MVDGTEAYSYQIQDFHKLKDDFQGRLHYCGRVLANIYEDRNYLQNWWWPDKCHVLLSGHANK